MLLYVCNEAVGIAATGKSSATEQLGHPPVSHITQHTSIIPLKTALLWSVKDALLCMDKPARKLLTHSQLCDVRTVPVSSVFKGKSQNSFFLKAYFPPQNIKRR